MTDQRQLLAANSRRIAAQTIPDFASWRSPSPISRANNTAGIKRRAAKPIGQYVTTTLRHRHHHHHRLAFLLLHLLSAALLLLLLHPVVANRQELPRSLRTLPRHFPIYFGLNLSSRSPDVCANASPFPRDDVNCFLSFFRQI